MKPDSNSFVNEFSDKQPENIATKEFSPPDQSSVSDDLAADPKIDDIPSQSQQVIEETSNAPNTPQTNEPVLTDSQVQPKNNFAGLIFLVLFVVLIGAAYFFFKNSQGGLKLQNLPLIGNLIKNEEEEKEIPVESSPTPTSMQIISSLIEIDNDWILYKNETLGFSINIPKKVYHNYGACLNQDDGSYRPKGDMVPVEVFEDNYSVFISTLYFWRLGEIEDDNGVNRYMKCEKIENNIDELNNNDAFEQQKWEIVTAHAENDEEVLQFIKENYGNGCKLKEKTTTGINGVFDVKIDAGSYESMQEAESADCLVNYSYVIKYSPEKKLVVTWKIGQSYNFFKDSSFDSYDEEMIESFEIN